MREVALASAALALLFVLIGAPFALLLRRPRDGWVAALCDAALLGLVLLPLGVTLSSWWGWSGAALLAGAWAVSAVSVARRRADGLPVPPGRVTPVGWVHGMAWITLVAVAAAVRLREVNFLPWVGDMGGYVNWANEFVRTGTLDAGWPPYLPAYLAISTRLFGPEHTTIGMALVGMLLLLGIARLLHQLGVDRWVTLGASGLVALNLHAVWFSSFPVSEALVAPLVVAALMLAHRAVSGEHRALQVVGACVVLVSLCLLRANGPLVLAPLMLVMLAVLVVPAWRAWSSGWAGLVAAGVVASATSYWYGVSRIPDYYVRSQLPEFVPPALLARMRELGLLDATGQTLGSVIAATVLSCAAVLGVGVLVSRRALRRPGPVAERGQLIVMGLAAAALAAVLALTASDQSEVWQIAHRMGLWLFVGAIIGTVTARWWRDQPARTPVLLLALLVTTYLALQDARLGGPREHTFYLYWDRYLFSEVFPGVVVLGAVGLHQALRALQAALRRVAVPRRTGTASVAVLGLCGAVAVAAWSLPQVHRATREVFLRGAFDLTEQLAVIADGQGDPVLWSASGTDGVPNNFFPNTWMEIATPLVRSFGVDVVNIDRHSDFAGDEVVTAFDIRLAATCAGSASVTVMDVAAGGAPLDERLTGSGLDATRLGTVTGSMQYLRQRTSPESWSTAFFDVVVWTVDVPEAQLVPGAVCSPRWLAGGSGRVMVTF